MPPSIVSCAPVTNPDSRPSSQATIAATSSGRPTRPPAVAQQTFGNRPANPAPGAADQRNARGSLWRFRWICIVHRRPRDRDSASDPVAWKSLSKDGFVARSGG
jgi:hypothetical protein